jgi:urease alpha subunit
MNLREIVDMRQGLQVDVKQPSRHEFKVKDQVVIYKPVGFGGKTREVIVGQILASAGEGKFVVSIPRPGGVATRTTVSASQLQPVTAAFRRSHVNINPAFRGQM